MNKKLILSQDNKYISGVCGGIGEYLNIDPTIIRIVWILMTIAFYMVGGIVAYLICFAIIPKNV